MRAATPRRRREPAGSARSNAARRDVSPISPGDSAKALASQLLKKLGVYEMDLPQVGHCGISPHTRPVLHRGAQMGISIDPQSRYEANGVAPALAEAVGPATRDRDHHPVAALYRTIH